MGEWVGGGGGVQIKGGCGLEATPSLIVFSFSFSNPAPKPPPQNLEPLNLIFPDLNQIGSVTKQYTDSTEDNHNGMRERNPFPVI